MNSDLDYKKKYLKYKNKYIALQKEMSMQEGGWPSFTTFSTKSKIGIYLFFVDNPDKYNLLLDKMYLLNEMYFKDSGSEISKVLGQGCWYLERKMDVLGKVVGKFGEELVGKVILKSCANDSTFQEVRGQRFRYDMTTFESLQPLLANIKRELPSITHFFVVDYNALKYNRISCLFQMPGPAPLQEIYQQQQFVQQPGQGYVQQLPGQQIPIQQLAQPVGQIYGQQQGQIYGQQLAQPGQQIPIQQYAQTGQQPGQGYGQKYDKK